MQTIYRDLFLPQKSKSISCILTSDSKEIALKKTNINHSQRVKMMSVRQRNMRLPLPTQHFLLMVSPLILSLVGAGLCEIAAAKDQIKGIPSSQIPTTTLKPSAKPLESTLTMTTSPSTKRSFRTTKAVEATESPTTVERHSTKAHTSIKGVVKSAKRQKLNSSSSSVGVHSPARLLERLAAIDCDLPVLPRESRVWRGNETHELNLPVTECAAGAGGGGTDEECPPVIVSWEGAADIQSGDILIVRIADALFLDTFEPKNSTPDSNTTTIRPEREQRTLVQPAVYEVTRQGHEHCDDSEGTLLDITPLDEHGAKIFTLYEKDLTEGVNLLIVVSENWKSQCVRLKVTVKSDSCGDSQDCSGKGICYTNVSMEGYECQCCGGYTGSHCEEKDPCNPSPCLNNGMCVDLSSFPSPHNYSCVCPYGITGTNCEKDPCYSSPCLNGGSCMTMAMNGSTTFHCACADGWAGAQCELSITGGACTSNPCVKGICIEQVDNEADGEEYRCFCEPGYTGKQCELEYNECLSSPCGNGGTCTDRVSGFSCSCGRGYTGNACQLKVDLCSPSPCTPHRFCVDRGNSYSCECPRGFIGDECHIPTRSACDNNPCAHGGTCWTDIDSFYCSCRPGYTGKLCEEDFILEPVMSGEGMETESRGGNGGGSVREVHMPLGLYHDRLHNVYIAAGTLGAAIAIVGVVVTACHCRVNKTYSRILSRLSRVTVPGPPHHWLQDKRAPLAAPFTPPSAALDTTDMYYTLDFSDSQSSPLIQ